jgi:very-short-patch-repair endonuclease
VDIDRFLASHDGVVSRDQARACGLTDDAIAWRLATGRWVRRAPRTFLDIAWAWTVAARVRTAAAWAGEQGTLIAITAAWWLGLGVVDPRPVTVALPPGCSRRAPNGIRVVQREVRDDRTRHRELWVTRTPLTVLDAAVALGEDGGRFLDRALQRHVDLDDLRRAQSRTLGRRGSRVAGGLLARAADRAASEAERRMLALLRRAGITGWRVNLEVVLTGGRRALLDIAFEDVRLAVEVDGWAHHEDVDRFVDGRARKRALVADGWIVVEVTWHDLVEAPDRLVDELRRTLARLAARA